MTRLVDPAGDGYRQFQDEALNLIAFVRMINPRRSSRRRTRRLNPFANKRSCMSTCLGNAADSKAIDTVRDQHVSALNEGNADAWVEQFASDGVQMPPNAPANVGKDMIAQWSRGLLNQFKVKFNLTVAEVHILGEWAFERGEYAIQLDPGVGGPTMEDRGKYVTIYRKSDVDGWQMAHDIWNSNEAPPNM
jgi:uncharacterized protein (TIGR02246 family)